MTTATAACGSSTKPTSTYTDAEVTPEPDTGPPRFVDAGPAFDALPGPRDTGASECPVQPLSTDRFDPKDLCDGKGDGGGAFSGAARICFPRPDDGGSCASTYTEGCILSQYSCGLARVGTQIACGPLPSTPESCCYEVVGGCAVGRPFTVEGVARKAAVAGETGWSAPMVPSLMEVDPITRAALAAAWTEEGCTEHASVASFSRMALELLSLGAPAQLVEDTLQAALDEKRHATAAFGLAGAYGGSPVGPGRLDIARALDTSETGDIAEHLAAEGCIAETVSAALVAEARARATCPVVKAHLAIVAEEEERHAVLAWRQLAWILGQHDAGADVRRRVACVFANAERYVGLGATATGGDPNRLRAHGQLPAADKRIVAQGVLSGVVRSAAAALLNGHHSHVGPQA